MAFRLSTFYSNTNPAGRSHNNATYVYRTDDTINDVVAAGYFNDVIQRLEVGDVIEVEFATFASAVDDTATAVGGKSNVTVVYNDGNIMHVVALASDEFLMTATMPDVSTAGAALNAVATDGNADAVAGRAGTIISYQTLLGGAIATADAAITSGNASDNQAFTGGAVTVANAGSAEGDIDASSAVTADGEFVAGDVVRLISDGASTNAVPLYAFFICQEV